MATPRVVPMKSWDKVMFPAVISILDAHVECTEAERFPHGGGTKGCLSIRGSLAGLTANL